MPKPALSAPHSARRSKPAGTLSLRKHTLPLSQMWPAFASCPRGLETLLADELSTLGAQACKTAMGGVEFTATWEHLQAMNLWSSLAGRILMRLAHEPCTSENQLYHLVKKTPWRDWFSEKQTLRVDLNNLGVDLPNARLLQLRVKDAVCDHFRDACGERPDVNLDQPDIRIVAAVGPSHTSVYLDLSGENLFKRGWREEKGTAPLKENLAAGLVRLSQWQPEQALMDPFCGSGTLLIEAAAKATDRAPGLHRHFAFENLKGFDVKPWQAMRRAAEDRFQAGLQRVATLRLVGSDITRLLIDIASHNARLAGLTPLLEDGRLRFEQRDARTMEPCAQTGVILCNPPYGERLDAKGSRLERDEAYVQLFTDVGTRLKQRFSGWRFCCLTADLEVRKSLGLSPKRKTPIHNGPLECRLFDFPLTTGQYRPRSEGAHSAGHSSAAKGASGAAGPIQTVKGSGTQ